MFDSKEGLRERPGCSAAVAGGPADFAFACRRRRQQRCRRWVLWGSGASPRSACFASGLKTDPLQPLKQRQQAEQPVI